MATPNAVNNILDGILQREGWPKVTSRPSDKGGLTKGGITYTSYAAWLKKTGRGVITPTDFVKDLTEEQARIFLVDSIAGSFAAVMLVDTPLFASMFDWATTSGPDDPVRELQRVLRSSHGYVGTVDGVYGPNTDAALRAVPPLDMVRLRDELAKRRVEFYVQLAIDRDPVVAQFRKDHPTTDLENVAGWVSRALGFV